MPSQSTDHRPASILGVCASLGEDFGVNPDWLRIGFAAALLFALEGVLIAYAVLGVIVLASRLAFPDRVAPAQAATIAEAPAEEPIDFAWRKAA